MSVYILCASVLGITLCSCKDVSRGFLPSDWREKTGIMEEYDVGYTSSTSSRGGKVYVETWFQRMTKGRSEICASLWRTGMGLVGKGERSAFKWRFRSWERALRWEQAWPKVWPSLWLGHWNILRSRVAECLGPLYKWPWNSGKRFGLVHYAVGAPDSWLLSHIM